MRIFKNGRIFTSAKGDDTLHEALVVDGDKIVFVGSNADAEKEAGVSFLLPTQSLISSSTPVSRS